MSFKLKRVYKCLQNGHAIQEKEDMNALKETIKVCERLFSEDYDDKYHKAHDKKYGRIQHLPGKPVFNKDGKKTGSTWETFRKNVNSKNKAQERKAFMKCWENGEKDRIADLDRLNELLKKYQTKWWS